MGCRVDGHRDLLLANTVPGTGGERLECLPLIIRKHGVAEPAFWDELFGLRPVAWVVEQRPLPDLHVGLHHKSAAVHSELPYGTRGQKRATTYTLRDVFTGNDRTALGYEPRQTSNNRRIQTHGLVNDGKHVRQMLDACDGDFLRAIKRRPHFLGQLCLNLQVQTQEIGYCRQSRGSGL